MTLRFQCLGEDSSLKTVVLSDSSMGNLPDWGTQSGHLIMLMEEKRAKEDQESCLKHFSRRDFGTWRWHWQCIFLNYTLLRAYHGWLHTEKFAQCVCNRQSLASWCFQSLPNQSWRRDFISKSAVSRRSSILGPSSRSCSQLPGSSFLTAWQRRGHLHSFCRGLSVKGMAIQRLNGLDNKDFSTIKI